MDDSQLSLFDGIDSEETSDSEWKLGHDFEYEPLPGYTGPILEAQPFNFHAVVPITPPGFRKVYRRKEIKKKEEVKERKPTIDDLFEFQSCVTFSILFSQTAALLSLSCQLNLCVTADV